MKLSCPHCPREFAGSRGLNVHITKVHKDAGIGHASDNGTTGTGVTGEEVVGLQTLPKLKQNVRVLKHIPKGARSAAAGKLCSIIESCLRTNSLEDWFKLLSFSFTALRVPEPTMNQSLTSKVKENIETTCVYFPEKSVIKSQSIYRSIEAKVHEGDVRGAVRLLLSDSSLAPNNDDTLTVLKSKHPSPSRQLVLPSEPDITTPFLTVSTTEVVNALGSFHNGSAAGLDGLRPQHLKELTSASAGSNAVKLVESLTKLCNFLLRGMVHPQVCPYLYGASVCALEKKGGGIRPIAVGSTIRRLVAKLGCHAVRDDMADYLQPHQVGFGTPLGCEAAIHATRWFGLSHANTDQVILKLDIKNAFNSVERDTLLEEVKDLVPNLYPFLYQCYSSPSNLFYGCNALSSQVGAQQGDPLGPLIFCLAIQKTITTLESPLNVWYLDDGTIGGPPEVVLEDIRKLMPALSTLGLEVNAEKCELYPCSSTVPISNLKSILPGLKVVDSASLSLLGAPIFLEGVPAAFQRKSDVLSAALTHLQQLSAHVALVLLRSSFSMPRMIYILRTAPSWLFPQQVCDFDQILQRCLETILNVSLNESQWCQATLPIRYGGLGVRKVHDIGLVAFLASTRASGELVARILCFDGDNVQIPFVQEAEAEWRVRCSNDANPENVKSQRSWDDILSRQSYDGLLEVASGVDKARLKAAVEPESGAWLHALPSSHLGTLLDNDSLRVGAALRLGCSVCEPHQCICGARVESNGHHGLSCVRCAGRFSRHHSINEILRRALVSANLPCVLEPPGLSRTDGKRPDGLTLVPWARGRSLIWDATCVSTFAPSHLNHTMSKAGAAAENAARLKHAKYSNLEPVYDFVPVAVETSGPWCSEAKNFIKSLGQRLRERSGDPRSGAYLVQQISLAIQRGNAASIFGTFPPGTSQTGS